VESKPNEAEDDRPSLHELPELVVLPIPGGPACLEELSFAINHHPYEREPSDTATRTGRSTAAVYLVYPTHHMRFGEKTALEPRKTEDRATAMSCGMAMKTGENARGN
jgi:hypothetical protein